MDFKKKCIKIKKEAKKLGYDIKLTHIQEIMARVEGFSSRHAKLKNKKDNDSKSLDPFVYNVPLLGNPGLGKSAIVKAAPDYYYYDVHVFYSMDDGYSTFVKSKKELMDYEAINLAFDLGFLEEGDIKQVSYVEEMTKEDYENALGPDRLKHECTVCDNNYPDGDGHKVDKKFICYNCSKVKDKKWMLEQLIILK